MKRLIIIRGPAGAGKSTLARKVMVNEHITNHFEADMYFTNEKGEYNFKLSEMGKAHEWCSGSAEEVMSKGDDLIVSNTFTKEWELSIYLKLAVIHNYTVDVKDLEPLYASIHNVDQEIVDRQKKNFVPISEIKENNPDVDWGEGECFKLGTTDGEG